MQGRRVWFFPSLESKSQEQDSANRHLSPTVPFQPGKEVQEATTTPTHVRKERGSAVWDPVKLRSHQWEAHHLPLCWGFLGNKGTLDELRSWSYVLNTHRGSLEGLRKQHMKEKTTFKGIPGTAQQVQYPHSACLVMPMNAFLLPGKLKWFILLRFHPPETTGKSPRTYLGNLTPGIS